MKHRKPKKEYRNASDDWLYLAYHKKAESDNLPVVTVKYPTSECFWTIIGLGQIKDGASE